MSNSNSDLSIVASHII